MDSPNAPPIGKLEVLKKKANKMEREMSNKNEFQSTGTKLESGYFFILFMANDPNRKTKI